MDDTLLLRQYVDERSEAAFARLVNRYTPMVYSSALRQLRDPGRAQDVTQAVFICLAKNAARIRGGTVLGGWLMTVTRNISANTRKMEARRQHHERKAAEAAAAREASSDPPLWERVAPALDDAMAKLGGTIRDAMLLRYFQGLSVREVAQELDISEDAAKQRLSRGVEQLRKLLAPRGAVVPSAMLSAMLAAQAVHPAPAGLAPAVASAASKAGSTFASKGWLTIMALTKTKAIVAIAAIALVGGSVVAVVGPGAFWPGKAATQTVVLGAPTPTPVAQGALSGPAISWSGTIVDPQGNPVAGAEVFLSSNRMPVDLYRQGWQQAPLVRTGADGSFSFPPFSDAKAVIARSALGVAIVPTADLHANRRVPLTPWGHIQGTVYLGTKPYAGQQTFETATGSGQRDFELSFFRSQTVKTDANGHFSMPRVQPGEVQVSRLIPWTGKKTGAMGGTISTHTQTVQVKPGETASISLGGTGRPVIGKIVLDNQGELPIFIGWIVPIPAAAQDKSIHESARASAPRAGAATVAPGAPTSFGFYSTADGSFRVEDVPGGHYRLSLRADAMDPGSRFIETAAQADQDFTVAEMTGGRSDQAQDLRTITAQSLKRFKPGDVAPQIEAVTAQGSSVRLGDFKGKYVLLRIRDRRQSAFGSDPGDLIALWDRFHDDDRFVLFDVAIGSKLLPPPADPKEAMPWTAFSMKETAAHRLPAEYRHAMAPMFLISPDGTLLAKNIDPRSALTLLNACLGGKSIGQGLVTVLSEHHASDVATADYRFKAVPSLSAHAAGRAAKFQIVDGNKNPNISLAVLNDGAGAKKSDDPANNFFFDAGSMEGRLLADLGKTIPLTQVNTYSWHVGSRCPQVYKLYGSDGTSANFDPSPRLDVDPRTRGWDLLAVVDTLPKQGETGGQDAVSISAGGQSLGTFRYLLFVTFVTETDDSFGHTFFSEIDIAGRE